MNHLLINNLFLQNASNIESLDLDFQHQLEKTEFIRILNYFIRNFIKLRKFEVYYSEGYRNLNENDLISLNESYKISNLQSFICSFA